MGVSVSPGIHLEPGITHVKYDNGGRKYTQPNSDVIKYSNVVNVGTQIKSTSPRVLIKGTKWSLSHPYTRAAVRYEKLGGHITRSRTYSDGTETYSLQGGLPTGSSDMPAVVQAAGKSPFANANGLPGPIPTNLGNQLITEMIIKAGDRKWNMGEALGESSKTFAHLSKTAKDLLSAYRSAKVGNWGRAAKTLGLSKKDLGSGKSASSRWLELQYGWMPLISDLYDANQVFTEGLSRPQTIRAVRRLEYDTYNMARNSKGTGTGANPRVIVSGSSVLSGQAIGHFRLNDERMTYMQQLGVINPAEIAWNLMPFTFVTDWFLPIGNLLEAATATVGLTFIDGSLTHKVETNSVIGFDNHSSLNAGAGFPNVSWSPMYSTKTFGMVRTPLTYVVPLPYYKNPFSTKHAISALALWRQLKRMA